MDKTCANCATAETREDGSLFCPTQEEPTGLDDTCSDWQSKLKVAKTCAECGYIKPDAQVGTGYICAHTGYECASLQPACNDYTEPIESEVDESESLTGKGIEEEAPPARRTIDFNHTNIPRFSSEYAFALAKVEQFLRDNPGEKPKITTVDVFHEDYVKTSITVTLPTNFKLELDSTDIVRENSTIRMIPPMQTDLFDHSEDSDA